MEESYRDEITQALTEMKRQKAEGLQKLQDDLQEKKIRIAKLWAEYEFLESKSRLYPNDIQNKELERKHDAQKQKEKIENEYEHLKSISAGQIEVLKKEVTIIDGLLTKYKSKE